jgi:hypothetical protein
MLFAGKGEASDSLKEYARSNNVGNVGFVGFYRKEEEASIVAGCDFVNIFFPDDVKHSAIMSNRFYLALVHKKPMIVTAGSVQARLVERYGLGVIVGNDCQGLDGAIRNYLRTYSHDEFCERCNTLLASFVEEYLAFENAGSGLLKA